MKSRRLLTINSIFILAVVLIVSQMKLSSNPNQPPAGYTNDPDPSGSLTCANSGCHSGSPIADSTKFTLQMGLFSAGTGAQNVVVSGTTTYQADSVYYMTVTGTGSGFRYGFELTVVDAAPTPGNMAGTLAVINTTTTKIGTYQPSGSTLRQYMGHKNATTATKTWTFKWTAPHTGVGPLTVYYVGMNANNNGNEVGDLVYNATKVISEQLPTVPTGINSLAESIQLSIYPNPASNQLFIRSNEFEVQQVNLYNENGALVSQTNLASNKTLDISELPIGIYIAEIKTKDQSVKKRFVKM